MVRGFFAGSSRGLDKKKIIVEYVCELLVTIVYFFPQSSTYCMEAGSFGTQTERDFSLFLASLTEPGLFRHVWTLVDPPSLPHMRDVLRLLEQFHLLQRILHQGDQICIVADFDPAAFGLHSQIAQRLGPHGRGGLDGLQRCHATVGDGVRDFTTALAVREWMRRRRGNAQVRAQCNLKPGFHGQLVCCQMVSRRLQHLPVGLGRHEFGVVDADFDDRARGDVDGALGLHDADALVVHVRAVFDGVDSCLEGRHDAHLSVHVRGHNAACAGGFLDHDLEFLERELLPQRIVRDTEDSAACEDFDALGAPAHQQADGAATLVDPVRDDNRACARRQTVALRVAHAHERPHHARWQVKGIAVSCGLRDRSPGRVDVRADERALVDRLRNLEPKPGQLAHRCEAAHQYVVHVARDSRSGERRVRRKNLGKVERPGSYEVDVAVPEARH